LAPSSRVSSAVDTETHARLTKLLVKD
jgi:hypothetical protein